MGVRQLSLPFGIGMTVAELEFIGPFKHHDVVVNGWQVPFLRATPLNGGRVHLNLDCRFGVDLTVEEAERIVPFLADCIAVALGYTSHPEGDQVGGKLRYPFARVHSIRTAEDE
jgi:hypothetical protein